MRPAALLLLAALALPARADEARGLALAREARARLLAGEPQAALELLDRARIELPGDARVACTRGDALLAAGRPQEAQAEYERALSGPQSHHAHFNRGVARHGQAEAGLAQAGVPADVAALPEGPQPAMLQAVQAARPALAGARDDFLEALDLRDEPAARESLAALNRRLDALQAIEEELRRREEQQRQQDQQQPQPQDRPQDPPEDRQPPPDEGGQPPPQPDAPPPDEQQPPQPDDQAPPQDGPEPPPQPEAEPSDEPEPRQGQAARELSEEEVRRLLDRLERLEEEARERARARAASQRRPVEKDW